MIFRRIATVLAAGVLVAAIVPIAAAQGEDLRMGDDPAYFQRVEVPEAGIAMTLPGGWTHEIVMESGEYQLPAEFDDGSSVPYTKVLSATSSSLGACILSTYEDMPMSLERHALERGQENTSSFVDEDPVISEIQRSAGPAIRLDLPGMLGWGHEYLFDMAGLRYVLSCFDEDLGDETFWPIADSIELLDITPADEPDTTDPSEASIDDRRVEFPEFGIGLTIPHFWTYELRREETDYPLPDEFGEDVRVPRTQFISAFPLTEGVCWVSTFTDMPMDPEQHVQEHGWAHYSSLSESTPETERVQLPAGEAYRVVYYSVFGGSVAYAFDLAGSRYLVDCVVGRDGGIAARSLAASVTAFGDEPPELGLQRLEFAEADIAVTLPVDWEVQSVMDFIDTINVAGPDAPKSDLWVVMGAFPDEETSCDIYMLGDIPLSLEDHGDVFARLAAAKDPPSEVAVESLALPIGDAVRVTETSAEGTVTTNYLFDVGSNREYLRCSTPQQPEDAWLSVAESIESLSGEPPAAELQRIEVEEAGMAISLPPDWRATIEMETEEMGLPPEVEGTYYVTTVLKASSDDGAICTVFHFEGLPFTLVEHAAANTARILEDSDFKGRMEEASVSLPAGEAIRSVVEHAHKGLWVTSYLMEGGVDRYLLTCGDVGRAEDDFLSIAETFGLLGDGIEPEMPEGATFWSEVAQFGTQVPVLDPSIEASLVSAWCDRALWFELSDGTFEERDECRLTIDPVEPLEAQAAWPQETVTLSGGACEWTSDFWVVNDGSEVWASSWSITVEPDGTAIATSTYGTDQLDC